MKYTPFSIILLLFFILTNPAAAGDGGNSNNLFIKKTINNKWSWVSRSLMVSRDNMSNPFFATADIGLRYKFTPNWSTDVVYRAAWLELGEDWRYENRPLINLNYSTNWQGYRLTHRSRVEFRIFEEASDDIRYRSEYRIVFPHELTRFKLKPYIEEEFFYSVNAEEVNENWLSAGFRYRLNPNTILKLGYRWQARKSQNQWQDRNVLVTGILLFF